MIDKFSGTLLTADKPDANGFVYPREVLEKALAEYQKKIDTGQALGTLDPNAYPIQLGKVSHSVSSVRMDGDDAVAIVKILDTKEGQKLRDLVERGEQMLIEGGSFKLTMMPVGHGNVDDDGVISNYTLDAINISDDQK